MILSGWCGEEERSEPRQVSVTVSSRQGFPTNLISEVLFRMQLFDLQVEASFLQWSLLTFS